MAKYVVGDFSFAKKGEVEQLLRSVLEELEVGARVTDPFVADLLTALAREHSEAVDKIGAGIEYWVVASNKDLGYTSKGFRAKQRGPEIPLPGPSVHHRQRNDLARQGGGPTHD